METKVFDISEKKWSVGDFSACVIADGVSYVNDSNKDEYKDEVNFFGGYLVCDNIRSEEDARLIAAAPGLANNLLQSTEMLEALIELFGGSMSMITKFGITKQISENMEVINKALEL